MWAVRREGRGAAKSTPIPSPDNQLSGHVREEL
jgi:hypothetical protein